LRLAVVLIGYLVALFLINLGTCAALRFVESTGWRWIRTRRPELYGPLVSRTGLEVDTRSVRFDEKGV